MSPPSPEDSGRAFDGAGEQLDRRLALLADRDRRLVLSTLADSGEDRLPVEVLTDAVLRGRPDDVASQSVRVTLHHVHLPKLQDAGVLEYDADASLVTYRGDPQLERCLRAVEDATAD